MTHKGALYLIVSHWRIIGATRCNATSWRYLPRSKGSVNFHRAGMLEGDGRGEIRAHASTYRGLLCQAGFWNFFSAVEVTDGFWDNSVSPAINFRGLFNRG